MCYFWHNKQIGRPKMIASAKRALDRIAIKILRELQADARLRNSELAAPALLLPSIQVNVRASRFPRAELNGARFLHSPVCLATGLAEVV
jgi:hypothetical protein